MFQPSLHSIPSTITDIEEEGFTIHCLKNKKEEIQTEVFLFIDLLWFLIEE